jgi:capsular exopolysaccharide synthesis family protein
MTPSDVGNITPAPDERRAGPSPAPGRDLVPTRGDTVARIRLTAAPPALTDKVNAFGLLKALRQRWLLALWLGSLGAGVAALVTWFAVPPSQYTARAMLYVASKQPNIIFKTSEDAVDFPTYQRTQLTWIKSHFVLNAALNKEEVSRLGVVKKEADPVAWLEKVIQVNFAGEILTISMNGPDPVSLPILVNAINDAYFDEIVNKETEKRRERFEHLKTLYTGYQEKLKQKRDVLGKIAEQLGSDDKATVRLTHQLALESRSLMERELMQVRMDLRRAETELKVRREAQQAAFAAGTATKTSTSQHPTVDQYIAEDQYIHEVQARITHLQEIVASNERLSKKKYDPSIRGPAHEIEELRHKIAAREQQLRDWCAQNDEATPESELAPMEERVRILKELERVTTDELATLSAETQNINKGSLGLERIQDEVSHIDLASKKVGDEIEALNVELSAPPRVSQIERADKPRPESDRRPQLAGMTGLSMFGFVLFAVAFYEHRLGRIGAVEEVVQGLGIPLVGIVPALPNRRTGLHWSRSDRDSEEAWSSLLVESIDTVRTTLLHASEVGSIRTVMVSSAIGGEGKTSLSCHLATSLARAGLRVLLLDTDLRNPSAHLPFDLPLEPGFSELLRGEVELAEAIQPTSATGLWMITAGQSDSRTIQSLAQTGLVGQLLGRMKEQFDFIVVDSAPVLPVADSLLIGQHVDAVICSVLRGVSRLSKVYAASERMMTLGIRILGAVMSGVHVDIYSSRYYRYRRIPRADSH